MREDGVIVFMDDDPKRAALQYQRMSKRDQERTFWVTTVAETIDMLEMYRERLDVVFLDYDLTGTGYSHPASEDNGLEVVRWLEKRDSSSYSHCRFVVHTWYQEMGQKMVKRLTEKGYRASLRPFGS
jgi:ActR/RegA family two-component response regulator